MSDFTVGSPGVDLGNWTEQDLDVGAGGEGSATMIARDTRITGGKMIAPGVIWIENAQALQFMLSDTTGAVGKWLEAILAKAEDLAKNFAPVDTGDLRASIGHEVRSGGARGIFGDLFVGVDYGAFQELGTSRNPPHPYMRPAILQVLQPYELSGEGTLGADMEEGE